MNKEQILCVQCQYVNRHSEAFQDNIGGDCQRKSHINFATGNYLSQDILKERAGIDDEITRAMHPVLYEPCGPDATHFKDRREG